MRWSRTNLLLADAAARVGAELQPVSPEPTDFLARLVHGEHAVIVSKTRSPFLTQVAQTLSNNKHVARRHLAAAGIPVVPDRLVDAADHRDTAVAWLVEHGRVVVKPNWGNRALGVHADIHDETTLLAAIARARALDLDEEAVLEPYVPGVDVRVAVIGGRFAAALFIERPILCGDGVATARQLVARLNEDPRRADSTRPSRAPIDRIDLDDAFEAMLAAQGVELDTPLPAGKRVEILGDEAETIDVTDRLHPGWCTLAEAACARLGVDVGGLDLRGAASAFEQAPPRAFAPGGPALLEVNVLPALHMHACPTRGTPRPVFEAFVRYCLQLPGAPPPCVAVPAW